MTADRGSGGAKPAVFLDRDGTLIEDRGVLRSPTDVVFFPDTVPALAALGGRFELFMVTHQPAIADGRLTAREAAAVNDFVVARLAEYGIRIRDVVCCPHRRGDGCDCIKPNPGIIHRAAAAHGLDVGRSFAVGDHPHDTELARRAGAEGLYVLTGHGMKHRHELPENEIALPGIREAVEWILAREAAWTRMADPDRDIGRAADVLRDGGVVAFPTETVYGLGANAGNGEAVARVFEIKGRPRFDPLIVHIASPGRIRDVAAIVPDAANELIRRFWPGPLTLVLPKRETVSDLVTAGLPTVGVRMPRHPVALDMIRRAGVPVAAPSANPFGMTSPTCADHVTSRLGASVDLVLDGGPCAVGLESTILSLAGDAPAVLRIGGLSVEAIESAIGPVRIAPPVDDLPLAPGRLTRHYAPHTSLALADSRPSIPKPGRIGLLSFRGRPDEASFAAVETLSRSGDLREAAAGLFAALRRLDDANLDLILAEFVPDHGLGRAINDRLRRAAAR